MSLTDNWEAFVASVEDGVKALAKNTVREAVDQAEADAKAFLNDSKDAMRRWGDALADGKISKDDFEFLLGGQKDLAKMHALKAAGVSKTRLERFRLGLISLVTNSAFEAISI